MAGALILCTCKRLHHRRDVKLIPGNFDPAGEGNPSYDIGIGTSTNHDRLGRREKKKYTARIRRVTR